MTGRPEGSNKDAEKQKILTAPQYRIGDYAKYLGVTPDFLKHYEQFRIVSSEQKENGYRYYPFSQSYRILESMRLRGYGLSLRDIDVALIDEDVSAVLKRLDDRVEVIEREIRFDQAVVAEHKALRAWFDQMEGKKEEWYITKSEEMLFLPHTSKRNFLKDKQIYDVLDEWLSLMPMVKSCMRIPCPDSFVQPLGEYAWGLVIPARIAEEFSLPLNEAVVRLPPKKTFFYHFNGQGWPQLNPQDLLHDGLYPKLSRLGIQPAGDISMTMFMYTHINTESLRYGYYAVPIE